MSDNENDRSEYTNKIRRLSNNEINAAVRNIIEEKRLNLNLSMLQNERKRADYNSAKTLYNVREFINNVTVSTGTSEALRKTQSAFNNRKASAVQRPSLSSTASFREKPNGFMNMLLSNSSTNTFSDKYQSTSSFDLKPHKDYLTGTSMNFNDILEISDTSESEDELDESLSPVASSRVNFASDRTKSSQSPNRTKIETIRAITTNVVNRSTDGIHRVRNQLPECKTAPIQRRAGGFKVSVVDDDPIDKTAAWQKYKNDKKKKGKNDAVFADEKLERTYYEVCAERDQFHHRSPEEIEVMKQRDPIFAKRYKQFLASKSNGKPAHYDSNDLNYKVFMPKRTIEREKQIIIAETKTQKEIMRQINLKKQELLNKKVKNFIKKLSST